jgi:hypothetical protein
MPPFVDLAHARQIPARNRRHQIVIGLTQLRVLI